MWMISVCVYLGFSFADRFLVTLQDTIHPVSVAACRATSTPMTAPRTEITVVVVVATCIVAPVVEI